MGRLWICLPLCLFMQDQVPLSPDEPADESAQAPPLFPQQRKACEDACSLVAVAAAPFPGTLSWHGLWQAGAMPRRSQLSRDLAGGLAALGTPGGAGWTFL